MSRKDAAKPRNLKRRNSVRARERFSRVLIVCEGSKTEPGYFRGIRAAYRLNSANVAVVPSQRGTSPLQVVEYALHLFKNGDPHRGLRSKSFDHLVAVFDRDQHASYTAALDFAAQLHNQLKNDEGQLIKFEAVASVPCFELWLMLHYEDVQAPVTRRELEHRLRRYLPDFEKGLPNLFPRTRANLETATQRAATLSRKFNARSYPEPFTGVGELVMLLQSMRSVP